MRQIRYLSDSIYICLSSMLLCIFLAVALGACSEKDDVVPSTQPADKAIEQCVAVVAPIGDAATKTRLERTAQWFADNFSEAQLGDTMTMRLKLEWYDEEKEDMTTLSQQLASRNEIIAVIGPFSNGNLARFAPAFQRTRKPLIAPTATSEDIVRRYAVASMNDMQDDYGFLWTLTGTDIKFTETMISLYRSWLGKYPEQLGIQPSAALFSPSDAYGQTFFDWAPFHAQNLGISLQRNEQYTNTDDLLIRLDDYLKGLKEDTQTALLSSNFCVAETTRQLCDVARLRRKTLIEDFHVVEVDGNPSWEDAAYDQYWESFEGSYRTWFGFSNLSEEGISSLSDRDKAMLQGYQGFSPYADPTTGFEQAYTEKFGAMPTFAECKFYDALLLTALTSYYLQILQDKYGFFDDHDGVQFTHDMAFNYCISVLCGRHDDTTAPGDAVWRSAAMRDYIHNLQSEPSLKRFCGASGYIVFDAESCTQLAQATYVHWQIMDGKIHHRTYFGPDGKLVVSPSASWNIVYDEETANKDFSEMAANGSSTITYPALSDQYAVLVQGSDGSTNYRHLSDVLSVYQLLRKGGFDDDHIILILDSKEAARHNNVIRPSFFGSDLMGGTDGLPRAVVDYDNHDLTAHDISSILLGEKSGSLYTVLPSHLLPEGADEAPNVFFYWSGHGRSQANGGSDEFEWINMPSGQGFTGSMLRQTATELLGTGRYRKLLVVAEPCYGEATVRSLEGIKGALAIVGASATEQSWADNWNFEEFYWMNDRFTKNVVEQLTANPAITYRNLYLYCAQHTLGSHTKIVNAAHFGNLYTTSPKEFIVYNKH